MGEWKSAAVAGAAHTALRGLLASYYLLTGQWYQPSCPAVTEGLPGALRALYRAEAQLAAGCTGAAGGRLSGPAAGSFGPGGGGTGKTGGGCGGKCLDNRK